MIVQSLYMHVFHFQATSHVCSSQNYNSQDQCYVKVWSLSFLTLVFSSRFIFVYQIICLWIYTLFATHSAVLSGIWACNCNFTIKEHFVQNFHCCFPALSSYTCIGRLLSYIFFQSFLSVSYPLGSYKMEASFIPCNNFR